MEAATAGPVAIAFRKTKEPYGWLGNMAPYPITYAGRVWKTSEALFQALRFADESIREAIRAERSPMTAKFLARKRDSEMAVARMGDQDVENMRLVLRLKVAQHPELARRLIETGEARIIEDCTNRAKLDRRPEVKERLLTLADPRLVEDYTRGLSDSSLFWGAALSDGAWLGTNRLGTLWMEVRSGLAAGDGGGAR